MIQRPAHPSLAPATRIDQSFTWVFPRSNIRDSFDLRSCRYRAILAIKKMGGSYRESRRTWTTRNPESPVLTRPLQRGGAEGLFVWPQHRLSSTYPVRNLV